MIMDYLKLAKMLELKTLQSEIESILKINLVKYYEALSRVNQSEENEGCEEEQNQLSTSNNNDNNGSKGLFFLPNGNAILLLNEEIIESVLKNSVMINLKNNKPIFSKSELNCNNKMNQMLQRGNKMLLTEIDNNTDIFSAGSANNSSNLNMNKSTSRLTSNKQLFDIIANLNENENTLDILNKFGLIDSTLINSTPLGIDLLKYFNKKETCDIQIKVNGHIFYGHRVILMCCSKYFEMMLSENFKENNMNEVEISDYNPEDFLYLLLFLYCDCISLDLDRALEMLKGADLFRGGIIKN